MSLKLGTTSILGISTVTTNVSPQAEGVVTFYDYDGTELYTYTTSEFLALSAMPSNPTHTGMIAQGWNWTLADAQQYVTNWGYLNIGQNYTTSSGATEIFIEIPSDFVDLSFNLRFAVNGTVAISWGDDTAISFVSGTSDTTITSASHTYATYGNYCISISLNSGTAYGFYGNSSTNMPTVYGNGQSRDYNIAHASTVKEIHCGDAVRLRGYGFSDLYNLRAISLSLGTTIPQGQYVFRNLYSLSALIIPSNSKCYLYNDNLYMAYSLRVLSMPNNLLGFGSSIVLNGGGYGVDSITLPTLPSTVTTSYTTFTNSSVDQTFSVFIDPSKGVKRVNNFNITIANTSTISDGMFANSFLREITWPVNISSLPRYAFYRCFKLKNVSVPNTVSSIGAYAFFDCYGLISVTMSDSVTTIGDFAFSYCSSLKSVHLSDSITQISNSLFSNCYALESIDIPSSVTSIKDYAFTLCYALQSLTLPTGLLTISSYAFQQCRSLFKVIIPSTVTSISTYAFTNCLGMKEYHILATTVPTLGTNAFYNIPSDCKIYVPQASLEAYKTASNWSNYASYMVGE